MSTLMIIALIFGALFSIGLVVIIVLETAPARYRRKGYIHWTKLKAFQEGDIELDAGGYQQSSFNILESKWVITGSDEEHQFYKKYSGSIRGSHVTENGLKWMKPGKKPM